MRPVRQTVHVLSAAGLLVCVPAWPAQPSRTPSPAPRAATAAAARKAAVKAAPAARKAPPRPAATAPVVTVTPAPLDPTRNLALYGITQVGDNHQAWLIDLTSREREPAGRGDSVFGFTVKEVGTDRVTLARAGRDYILRLGQKQVPGPGDPIPPPAALPAERWQRPAPVAAADEDVRPLPVVERFGGAPADTDGPPAPESRSDRRAGSRYRSERSGPFGGGYSPSPSYGPTGYPEDPEAYPGDYPDPYTGYPEAYPAEQGYPGSSVNIRAYGTTGPRGSTSSRRGARRVRPGGLPPTPQTARRRGEFRGDGPEDGAPAPIVNPQTLRRRRAGAPGPTN